MLRLWQGSRCLCLPECFGIWFWLHLKLSRYISTWCHHSSLSRAVILKAGLLTKVCSDISYSLMTKSSPAQSRGKGGSEKENWSCSLSLHLGQRGDCLGYLSWCLLLCAKRRYLADFILLTLCWVCGIHLHIKLSQSADWLDWQTGRALLEVIQAELPHDLGRSTKTACTRTWGGRKQAFWCFPKRMPWMPGGLELIVR